MCSGPQPPAGGGGGGVQWVSKRAEQDDDGLRTIFAGVPRAFRVIVSSKRFWERRVTIRVHICTYAAHRLEAKKLVPDGYRVSV